MFKFIQDQLTRKTYFLSKLLPLIISPLGIALIFIVFFIFNKSRKFLFGSIIILFIFGNGIVSNLLLKLVERPWERVEVKFTKKTDAIVVLSSGNRKSLGGKSKFVEWHDPDRFFAGIALLRESKAPKLIFTGGSTPYNPEKPLQGNIYIEDAIAYGLPKDKLFTTSKVFNTLQEARAVRNFFPKRSFENPKITLVTSAYHMQRAKKVFEREGFNVQAFPVDFKNNEIIWRSIFNDPYNLIPNAVSLNESSRSLREIIGRIVYRSW